MELERARQNKSFINQHFVSVPVCFGITGFRSFCFSIVFILWLAFFANQHTKSIEKHELFRTIAPKQAKIDMPCGNKKSVNLGACTETSVCWSQQDKIFPIFGFAYKL